MDAGILAGILRCSTELTVGQSWNGALTVIIITIAIMSKNYTWEATVLPQPT